MVNENKKVIDVTIKAIIKKCRIFTQIVKNKNLDSVLIYAENTI